jgi:kynureninase
MNTHASHITQPAASGAGAHAHLDTSAEHAARLDAADPLRPLRDEFEHPFGEDGRPLTYLCGNSLGLMPRAARALVNEELDDWSRLAVEGHLHSRRPWVDFHEHFRHLGARLVGAQPGEVVMMNSLTVNLHLLMVSFWRPEGNRTKILMERGAFPSDTYAVHSHVHARGLDPAKHVIEIGPRSGEALIREEDILDAIREAGDTLALVMIGGVNYATGQAFGIERITAAAHAVGALAGWDLAHWAGNLPARLHDWNVDFACWCSYKYLNAGPGAVAGCFVHGRHGNNIALPRFAGWWGNDPKTRFAMGPEFVARAGADGWQLSNPPIMALAPLLASLQLFDRVGMDALHAKSRSVTGYLRALLAEWAPPGCRIVTPDAPGTHGAQLSIAFERDARARHAELGRRGIVCDFREPNIVRLAPAPLYNGYADARAAAAALCSRQ